jgi:hypothetical protein
MQSEIDAIDYPPTHTYDLASRTPTGILANRVGIIDRLAPGLFSGTSFLDVGANKGYFSLRAAAGCDTVVAIEPMPECQRLLAGILPHNARLHRGTFGDFDSDEKFDRIFIGNGHHYPYREYGGWSWVERLAELSTGTVVLEGPIGMECTDMHRTFQTEELVKHFNRVEMDAAFDEHFELVARVPTVSYTPDRYIIHYERRHG